MAHLRKLNDHYKEEIINPATAQSDRRGLFEGLEQVLARRLKTMDESHPRATHGADGSRVAPPRPGLPVAPPAAGAGRVAQLTAFHEQQIRNVGSLDRQGEAIVRLRQWLYRQGATLTPNGKIVWSKSEAELKYDTELAQQDLSRIEVRGGRLYTADGKALDTKQMVTAARGPGWCIYVMSAENHIHVSSHAVGARHHSSLLAGGMVACAGEMRVHDGQLLVLSNKSGHYRPPPVYLTQVIRVLAEGGVEEDSYAVSEHLTDGKTVVEHAKASLFMDAQRIPVWPADDVNDTLVLNPRYAAAHAANHYAYPASLYSTYGGGNAGAYPYAVKN